MARVIIHSKNLAQQLWGEAVNTACHIINRVYLRPETNKTPYEIWRGKKPTVKYFRTFGSKCYILRDLENLGKFDSKSDEGILLGYSTNSRAYRVFNKRTETVMESINVVVDDEEVERPNSREENQIESVDSSAASTDIIKASPNVSLDESPSSPTTLDTAPITSKDADTPANPPKRSWVKHNHPPEQLLGTIDEWRRLSEVANQVSYICYLAQTDPKKVDEALQMNARCLPCMMSSINSPEMMFGPWFPVLQNRILLAPSGFLRIKQMSIVLWFGIKPVLFPRDILR
jgi:hypothetical protein